MALSPGSEEGTRAHAAFHTWQHPGAASRHILPGLLRTWQSAQKCPEYLLDCGGHGWCVCGVPTATSQAVSDTCVRAQGPVCPPLPQWKGRARRSLHWKGRARCPLRSSESRGSVSLHHAFFGCLLILFLSFFYLPFRWPLQKRSVSRFWNPLMTKCLLLI